MEIAQLLPDEWDGANGMYKGKNVSMLPYLLELYEIPNKIEFMYLFTTIVRESSIITNEKIQKQVKNKDG